MRDEYEVERELQIAYNFKEEFDRKNLQHTCAYKIVLAQIRTFRWFMGVDLNTLIMEDAQEALQETFGKFLKLGDDNDEII